jgi:hypothetical protein
MIVVIDTSVWIYALQYSGENAKPGQVIKMATHLGTIATCQQIDEEILRILVEKFGWTLEQAAATLASWLPFPLPSQSPAPSTLAAIPTTIWCLNALSSRARSLLSPATSTCWCSIHTKGFAS